MSDAAHWRKRAALLHYIQVVHEGRLRWLNVSSLRWNDLVSLASKSLRKKLELWYLLGISLDPVLAAPTCARLVRLAAALLPLNEKNTHFPLRVPSQLLLGRSSGAACGGGRFHHQRQRAAGAASSWLLLLPPCA
jgi:hypothetical protein